jgi:hypothetical protein
MKTFILSFFKNVKSFNNLLLNLTIKSLTSFSFIILIKKYYSYFRYILEYLKVFRFYNLFKTFFKLLALINILLGIYTLIIFTDFRYDDYLNFRSNFSISDLFLNFKHFLKIICNYINNLFYDDLVTINKTFNQANTKAKEIVDLLDNKKEKFMVDNPIFIVIKDFKEYLASLSAMELCLVINITSCVFILTCIVSILFALSGNYLIDKFSLEQKLPKLSQIIQLRVKFQHYYVIINSVFIILAILSLIFVNIVTLIHG